jgi:methylenetetrahydrofolate dehydrogenase (NADP+) / methenyltetrahydrofolate cyclohydrolase
MPLILSGRDVSKFYKEKIKKEVEEIFNKEGRRPTIACVLVGNDPASQIYVKNKERTAEKLGIKSEIFKLPSSVSQKELLSLIDRLNDDKSINGILVQLPLPRTIDEKDVLLGIKCNKDVDVFHPQNIGNLWTGNTNLYPCTPNGIMKFFEYYKLEISGKNVVIIGRSNIVGKPLGALFLKEHATVTFCHSRTKNLSDICKRADILVGSIGRPHFITKSFVKPGAVVIDVGINRLEDGRVVGDVLYEEVKDIASAITPVPGGVGPMTIAMLMQNTLDLYKENRDESKNPSL